MKNVFAVVLDAIAWIVGGLGVVFGVFFLDYLDGSSFVIIVIGLSSATILHWLAEVLHLLECIKYNTSQPHYVLTSTPPQEYTHAFINSELQGLPKI